MAAAVAGGYLPITIQASLKPRPRKKGGVKFRTTVSRPGQKTAPAGRRNRFPSGLVPAGLARSWPRPGSVRTPSRMGAFFGPDCQRATQYSKSNFMNRIRFRPSSSCRLLRRLRSRSASGPSSPVGSGVLRDGSRRSRSARFGARSSRELEYHRFGRGIILTPVSKVKKFTNQC